MIPILSWGQVAQSFNSGGLQATSADIQVSSGFGEIFVKSYQVGNTRVNEGIFSNNLLITAVSREPAVSSVKVYPTQFKDEFFIESEHNGRYVIYSVTGQAIKEGILSESKTTISLQSSAEWHLLKITLEKNNESIVFKVKRGE
jgi:hypothetical protein